MQIAPIWRATIAHALTAAWIDFNCHCGLASAPSTAEVFIVLQIGRQDFERLHRIVHN
jgi:hypothetical protein